VELPEKDHASHDMAMREADLPLLDVFTDPITFDI
jgi:hypothetical protein